TGAAAWRSGLLPPSAPRPSSTGDSTGLTLVLPKAWAESARTPDSVDYRRVVRGFETGLLLRMQRIGLVDAPRQAAANELDRVSVAAGFEFVSSRPLPRSQIAG